MNRLEKENAELREALRVEENIVQRVQRELKDLHDFKSFVKCRLRERILDHPCSDYETIMAIDERLTTGVRYEQ